MTTAPLNFYVSTLHEPDAVLSSTVSSFLSSKSVDFIFKYLIMDHSIRNMYFI